MGGAKGREKSSEKKESIVEKFESFAIGISSKIGNRRLDSWLYAYFHPAEAYAAQGKAVSLSEIISNQLPIAFISSLTSTIYMSTLLYSMASLFGGKYAVQALAPMNPVLMFLYGFAASFFLVLLACGAFHYIARALGGKNDLYGQTNGLVMVLGGSAALYAIPMILAAIPCLGLVFVLISFPISAYGIYSFYRMAKAASGLSGAKVVAAGIIAALVVYGGYFLLISLLRVPYPYGFANQPSMFAP